MTKSEICVEIVKRVDEDFEYPYFLERAWSHFRSSIYALIQAKDKFTVEDYKGMSFTEMLVLGWNCCYIGETLIESPLDIMELLGVYWGPHYSDDSSGNLSLQTIPVHVELCESLASMSLKSNNRLNRYNKILYVCYIGKGNIL